MTISLDLTKKTELLTLNLTKAGVLTIPTMEVRAAIDKSGSMDDEFRSGLVDLAVDRFLAFGLKFDDNATLDVGFFNGSFHEAPSAVAEDAGKYLKKARQSASGGTAYGPIIENFETRRVEAAAAAPAKKGIFGSIFGSKTPAVEEGTSPYRAYVGIITDGDNGDQRAFEAQLAKTSGDTFFQFIAIGNSVNGRYLSGLSEKYPHVSFVHIPDLVRMSDDKFYETLCHEKFASWVNKG